MAAAVRGREEEFRPLLERLAGFELLEPSAQDAALRELDASNDPAFSELVDLAHSVFYAAPRSWATIGYTTHVPGRP